MVNLKCGDTPETRNALFLQHIVVSKIPGYFPDSKRAKKDCCIVNLKKDDTTDTPFFQHPVTTKITGNMGDNKRAIMN